MSWFPIPSSYVRNSAWRRVKLWIRQSFPTVPTISTRQLANWLERDSLNPPALIDAREPEEFAVSHLPNAYRAQSVAEVVQAGITRDMPVVVYCSIGYRSARLVQALNEVGYQATNLEGSIFQWANEGRGLVTSQGSSQNAQATPTQKVHPYNDFWGLLLEPNHAE